MKKEKNKENALKKQKMLKIREKANFLKAKSI